MPLPIRDGNQSLTTLSTILVSNSHIPAHTVVSFGIQGITDIATAVSGVELGPNTLNALENITVTLGQVTITGGLTDTQLRASAVTIGGSVTATISGTASVTFGSASILNFPATQTVTFTQAPVTFGTAVVTGSVSVLNLPATQTVTFSQASVTFGTAVITGSTSILNFPSTQTVTFGTSVVTGSVSVLNFPASQSVTFTTASVTFGTAVITGSTSILGTATITGSASILNFPATQTVTFTQIATHGVTIANTSVTVNGTFYQATQPVSLTTLPSLVAGTSQIGSVTASISGTVTANLSNVAGTHLSGTIPSGAVRIGWGNEDTFVGAGLDANGQPLPIQIYLGNSGADIVTIENPLPISGTVTANLGTFQVKNHNNVITSGYFRQAFDDSLAVSGMGDDGAVLSQISSVFGLDLSQVTGSLPISGTVTIGSALPTGTNRIGVVTIGAGTVTLGASTAQIGSVTASISGTVPVSGTFFQATQPVSLTSLPALVASTAQIGSVTASISGTVPISISSVTVGNSVTIGSLPALAAGTAQIGSVTASISANPSGALTTRFGSVTTANTAQITTAVTNTSRKYLFAQNISVGSVTVGIGFSPTTTQGIQLSAGSGIVFDSFCPTGAVYWLGATTGAAWSILEG